MNSKTGWILTIGLGLVLLFLLPSLLMGRFWAGGYDGMMGWPGMMGGWGFMTPFRFLGMALMWLLLLATIVLVVLGVVSLIKGLNNTNQQNPGVSTPENACQNCGKAALPDWNTCPYCGKPL
jgi:uncharacterized membrane protein